MFPDVSTALATQTQGELIERVEHAHQARLARRTTLLAPCTTTARPQGGYSARLGCTFRHWLAAGQL